MINIILLFYGGFESFGKHIWTPPSQLVNEELNNKNWIGLWGGE